MLVMFFENCTDKNDTLVPDDPRTGKVRWT